MIDQTTQDAVRVIIDETLRPLLDRGRLVELTTEFDHQTDMIAVRVRIAGSDCQHAYGVTAGHPESLPILRNACVDFATIASREEGA